MDEEHGGGGGGGSSGLTSNLVAGGGDETDDNEDETMDTSHQQSELKDTIKALRHLVSRDPLAADMQLSLFASAVFSYRWPQLVPALPEEFWAGEAQGMRRVAEALRRAPPVRDLLMGGDVCARAPLQSLRLMHWLLLHRPAILRALPRTAALTRAHAPAPDFIFAVNNPRLDEKWNILSRNMKIVTGYVGQPLEVFYRCGLRCSELGAALLCVAECRCAVSPRVMEGTVDGGGWRMVLREGFFRLQRLLVFRCPTAKLSCSRRAASTFKVPQFKFEVVQPRSVPAVHLRAPRSVCVCAPYPPYSTPPIIKMKIEESKNPPSKEQPRVSEDDSFITSFATREQNRYQLEERCTQLINLSLTHYQELRKLLKESDTSEKAILPVSQDTVGNNVCIIKCTSRDRMIIEEKENTNSTADNHTLTNTREVENTFWILSNFYIRVPTILEIWSTLFSIQLLPVSDITLVIAMSGVLFYCMYHLYLYYNFGEVKTLWIKNMI